jgi:hypothetical protein
MPDDREQVIRERAYEIWEQQGCPAGHNLDHWLQADAEIANDKALGIRHEGKLEPPLPRGPQAIKDVLVFLGTRAAADSCLRIAADLARKHRAYLTAVYLPVRSWVGVRPKLRTGRDRNRDRRAIFSPRR